MTTHTPSDLRRFEPVSDALLLAAIDRAQRHSSHGPDAGVHWGEVLNHLGFAHTGAATHKLRPQADALLARGLIEPLKRNGRPVIRLTSSGRKRLAKARRTDREALDLPEAPQHREWRRKQTSAAEQIDSVRDDLRGALSEASRLIDSGDSDAWFALGKRINVLAHRLGTAIYCAHEWREPDDAQADIDESMKGGDPRIGRRNPIVAKAGP
jgi:hypothetical protein